MASKHYRGWRSTKLHLSLITMGLVCVGYAATGFAQAAFGEFCMALMGAAGIYSSAATVEKFAGGSKVDPESGIG